MTAPTRSSKPQSLFDAQLDEFPQPAGQRRQSAFKTPAQREPRYRQSTASHIASINHNSSLLNQIDVNDDPALRAAQLSTASSTGPRTSRFQPNSSRRQSQLPPSSIFSASSRPPRKSVGPGLGGASSHDTVFDANSRTLIAANSPLVASGAPKPQAVPKSRSHASIATASDIPSAGKLGSLKGSPQDSSSPQLDNGHSFLDLPYPPTNAIDQENGRSPARLSQQQVANSSLLSRRQSNALGLGGLGARTVSPTDVRKSRRMSVTNKAPPIPTRSPSPDFSPSEKPPPTPPLSLRQKPMTPVSLHDLADLPQRKNSGRSVDSRSSYNSAKAPSRPTSSSSQHRSSFINFSARSPVTKSSRNHPSTNGQDSETVPPVPAIPKAYESPSETMEKPFFSDYPTTTNFHKTLGAKLQTHATEERYVTPEEPLAETSTNMADLRANRRLTLGARMEAGRELPSLVTNRPQVHQHQRLPPINLLPLSTPTTNRIASMTQKSSENTKGITTPPPHVGVPKTPSTPMTASKATFPSYDFGHNFDLSLFPNIRSSTSYAAQKSENSTLNYESGSESPAVVTPASPAPTSSARHGPSPYGSFSLPRPTVDMQQIPASRKNQDAVKEASHHAHKSSRNLLRRPSTVSKQNKESAPAAPAIATSDVESAHSGTSLRRKLSKGWRRSSSKASHSYVDDEHVPEKRPEMPPPKLPASNVIANARKSPKPPPSAVSSQTDLASTLASTGSANTSHTELPRYNPKPSSSGVDRLQTGSKSTNSLFSPMSRMLGTRSSSANIKPQRSTPHLDRDDQAAEDEMRKLGSKKKEFEASARELDELQRRAIAKEAVSPNQATRMAALNIFEKGEIIDYQNEGVYFCGTRDAKKFVGDLAANNSNFGFDDERGDYNIVMGDHLAYRYEVIDILGKGSFGQVVRCVDHKTGGLVAVKIIRNKKRFHQQALVEVNILQKIRDWVS